MYIDTYIHRYIDMFVYQYLALPPVRDTGVMEMVLYVCVCVCVCMYVCMYVCSCKMGRGTQYAVNWDVVQNSQKFY